MELIILAITALAHADEMCVGKCVEALRASCDQFEPMQVGENERQVRLWCAPALGANERQALPNVLTTNSYSSGTQWFSMPDEVTGPFTKIGYNDVVGLWVVQVDQYLPDGKHVRTLTYDTTTTESGRLTIDRGHPYVCEAHVHNGCAK